MARTARPANVPAALWQAAHSSDPATRNKARQQVDGIVNRGVGDSAAKPTMDAPTRFGDTASRT